MSKIRLVCPRCGARYDVPPEVIPPEGRDVQCSNCAHTWFQSAETVQPAPTRRDPAPEAPVADQPAPAETHPAGIAPVEAATVETGHHASGPDAAGHDASGDDHEDQAREDEAQPRPVQPRSLPPEITEVFRQEREHEARRRGAASPIESQPDLGLPDPPDDAEARRARAERERMAFVRDEETASPPPAFVAAGSRRDLLPDVEEISETLRGSDRRADGRAERPARPGRPGRPASRIEPDEARGGGFARGFVLALALAAIAAAVYLAAPRIIERQPQAEAALRPYVNAIDEARLWLHGAGADIRAALDDLGS
ncbi:zinc-ribbon domain-containing protein [Citreimonas salinaria]|uniref:zinc-ribbon domain-containing protein n=1 Tax=Citreimonas salinaria TaxID=321339 RepID=UPI001C4332CA|nr:zinc-ribbon domain-containing protein [Citreimonas salinaria]